MKLSKEAIEIIEGKNFAHVATLMSDGSPHVAPVWVDHDGDIILINTIPRRVKHKNILRDSRVAISIVDEKDPYRNVVIRGKVIGSTKEGAFEHINSLSKKYLGKDYPWPDRDRIIIKIEPEHVTVLE